MCLFLKPTLVASFIFISSVSFIVLVEVVDLLGEEDKVGFGVGVVVKKASVASDGCVHVLREDRVNDLFSAG